MLVSWHRSDGSMQRPSRVARNWRSEPAGASGRSSLMTVFLVALEDLVAGRAKCRMCDRPRSSQTAIRAYRLKCADRGRSRLLNSNELQGLLPFDIPPHLGVAPWMLINRPVARNCLHGDSALPPERVHKVGEVFGINRELPVNYVSRQGIDDKLIDNLTQDHHIVIFGSSKQGKTCLRKLCLNDDDYIVVSCQSTMDLKQVHAAILKSAGYEMTESSTKSSDGSFKLSAKFTAKTGVIIASGQAEGGGELNRNKSEQTTTQRLELDAQGPNDVIAALQEIDFRRFLVLEDFHLPPYGDAVDLLPRSEGLPRELEDHLHCGSRMARRESTNPVQW